MNSSEQKDTLLDFYAEIGIETLKYVAAFFKSPNPSSLSGTQEHCLKTLDELGMLNDSSLIILKKNSPCTISKEEIKRLILKYGCGEFNQQIKSNFYRKNELLVDLSKLENTRLFSDILKHGFKEMQYVFKPISKHIQKTQYGEYIYALLKAYIEAYTGLKSHLAATDDAIKTCQKFNVQFPSDYDYRNDIEDAITTAVNATKCNADLEEYKKQGYTHVEVSQHLGARVGKTKWENHAGWQGKVFRIDDLEEETGYGHPEGLCGINCRHRIFPFVVGVSRPKQQIDQEENAKVFYAEQGLYKMQAEIKAIRKKWALAKSEGRKEDQKALKKQILAMNAEIDEYCLKHNLKRQSSRECI